MGCGASSVEIDPRSAAVEAAPEYRPRTSRSLGSIKPSIAQTNSLLTGEHNSRQPSFDGSTQHNLDGNCDKPPLVGSTKPSPLTTQDDTAVSSSRRSATGLVSTSTNGPGT